MKKRSLFLSAILLTACLTACGASIPTEEPAPEPTPVPTSPTVEETPEPVPTPEPDPIAEQIAGMTVEEKVGQLLVAGMEGLTPGEDAVEAIQEFQVGGIILFRRNVEDVDQLSELTHELRKLSFGQVPLFVCIDEEGGRVSRMPADVEEIPSALTFGSVTDPEQREDACYALGRTLAWRCKMFGIGMDFAPVLDIWSNPQNTVIGDRAFGKDAETVISAGMETARGLMDGGVVPVVKHFPGHGDTAVDSHVGLPVVTKTLDELEQMELRPFRAAVESGVPAVMVGHILLTAMDAERPATFSPAVVNGLLREEMGFDGVVVTDDLTMGAVNETYGLTEGAVMAVEAGCDLLLVCHGIDNLRAVQAALLDAVESGRITEQRLNESVYRILALKAEYGLYNGEYPIADRDALNGDVEDLKNLIF